MIRPTKHSHPDRTAISTALVIIKHMKKIRICDYPDLEAYVMEKITGGRFLFIPALNILYLLGLIEYRPKIDAIEYVGPNENF